MSERLGTLVEHIRRLSARGNVREPTDGQLLEAYAARRDESAFAALVRRHGGMVWSVCRQVLGHETDAEDAFQATFLVLARRAGSVRNGEALAGWLHGVAYHTALRAKRDSARRRLHEGRAKAATQPSASWEAAWREVQTILAEEVRRLPEKQRVVFVLCCLEANSRVEAARQLGLSEGTVSSRLAHARERLRLRLARRGVELSAVLAAVALAPAVVPAALTTAAVRGSLASAAVPARVAALAEGVLKATAASKLRAVAVLVLTLGLLAAGAGLGAHSPAGAKPAVLRPKVTAAQPKAEAPRTDRLGDPLPDGAVARIGTVRLRHGQQLTSLFYSRDGRTVVSAGYEAIRLWDVKTGRERRRFTREGPALAHFSLSPDGRLLAVGEYPRVRLWDTTTGKEVRTLGGGADPQYALAFSPDGKWLATVSMPGTTLTLWDAKGEKRLRQFELGEKCTRIDVAPDGKTMALRRGQSPLVRLWDVAAGKELCRVRADDRLTLYSVAFSPDGRTLVTAGRDGVIRLWDRDAGKELRRLTGHDDMVTAVAVSPDGKTLASGSRDGTIRFWEMATGREARRFRSRTWGAVWDLAFSPDGKRLAAGGVHGTVRLWDTATGRERRPYDGPGSDPLWVCFAPDGKTLVAVAPDEIGLWDARTGRDLRRFEAPGEEGLALSPDGTTLATGGAWWHRDEVTRLWRLGSGKLVHQLRGETYGRAAFSPDGRMLGVAGPDGVRLWDVATGKEVRRIGTQAVGTLAFSPDGRSVAGSCADQAVRLWDVAGGKELWRTGVPYSGYADVAFSPDGRLLAVMGRPRGLGSVISLWDASTGKEVRRCGPNDDWLLHLAFSPDGRTLATGGRDTVVRLWEVATGQERRRLVGHRGHIPSLSFSPDGQLLASASSDSTALVWDLTGRARRGHSRPRPLSARELEACWADLAADAARAQESVLTLAAAPRQAVEFLSERLRPVAGVDGRRVAPLLAALDSEEFARRQKAARELEALGFGVEPALRKALTGKPSLETRRRIQAVLERLGGAPTLRVVRAVEVLEMAGTPAARRLLEKLARGIPEARQTQEAKAALRRLAGRRAPGG